MKAKVNVSQAALDDLIFACGALEVQYQALLSHKHPHQPAIARCRSALIRVKTISLAFERALRSAEVSAC